MVAIRNKRNFEDLLCKALDEGLSSLGESPKQAIFFNMEKVFDIKKQEIPSTIEAFDCALQKIFEPEANFLESLIMKFLFEEVGQTVYLHASKDFKFKRSFLNKVKKQRSAL